MNTTITSAFADTPAMPEFQVSNHLLGNRAALDAAWERDGYWFFRDVLDKAAIGRVRSTYLEVLNELGVIDPSTPDRALYNGASLDGYPIYMGGPCEVDPLFARYPRDQLVNDPAVKPFFEEVFGDEVYWVPNSEFQAVPPRGPGAGTGATASRFNYVHCDGPNNKGLPLRVVWIPLADIEEEVGGLAVAEGLHRPCMGDFPRPSEGIREADVPVGAWRRTIWRPGDVLIFSLELPHSGLANRSATEFRLSMDIRAMRKSDGPPVVGTVAAIDACAIAVDDAQGQRHVFRIDRDTYCRISRGKLSGMPLTLEEIPILVEVGARVYVAADHGTAMFIRPQH